MDLPVKYTVTDAAISKMADEFMAIKVEGVKDEENAKRAHAARMAVKAKRVEVEKKRKELKADALEYGRKVDAEAKRITDLLAPIEAHLQTQEEIVTKEKERQRIAAQEAERLKREAEEARLRAEREAETKRLAEERAKLEAERAAMDAERKRLDEEKHKIEIEKARADAAAKARAEAEERMRREAEEAKRREEELKAQEEAERQRIEALRPDADKIKEYGLALATIPLPDVATDEAKACLRDVTEEVNRAIKTCNDFIGMA